MPVWVEAFIVVATIALVIQTIIMLSTLIVLRPIILNFAKMAMDLQARINPILTTTGRMLADSEGRVKNIVEDASAITHTARAQVENVDRVVTDAVEKLRVQIIHTDQIVTGTLDAVEDAGTKVRRSVLTPINQLSAIMKGLRVGLDTMRGSKRGNSDGVPQDEELFI